MLSILPAPQAAVAGGEQYGLTHRPFGLSLDQRFVYRGGGYAKAVDELRHALRRREGLVVLTGEAGTGKTMLCRTLLQQLEGAAFVSVVLHPWLTIEELLRKALMDFGVLGGDAESRAAAEAHTRQELAAVLQEFLASLIPRRAFAILVIDEAQHLDEELLEQIRFLLNFETDEAKVLQIVLVGDTSLASRLKRPEMRPLDQRVARRCELKPLRPHEVRRYVERRLAVAHRLAALDELHGIPAWDVPAGASRFVCFTPSAMRSVAAISRGIPRVINVLCDRALEIGCERQTATIDARIIRAARRRAALTVPAAGRRRTMLMGAAGLAAVLVLAAASHMPQFWPARILAQPAVAAAVPTAATPAGDADAPAPAVQPLEIDALAVADSFNLTAASFRSERGASAAVAELDSAGLPAFTRQLPGSPWHQVVVGPYLSEAETIVAQRYLAALGYPDAASFVERAPGAGALPGSGFAGSFVARVRASEP